MGCCGGGSTELKNHPFFNGVDWVQVREAAKKILFLMAIKEKITFFAIAKVPTLNKLERGCLNGTVIKKEISLRLP